MSPVQQIIWTKDTLKDSHEYSVFNEEAYQCPKCDKKFLQKISLQRHMDIMHLGKKHTNV